MRVCLVTGEFPPQQGGVGDYTVELSKALAGLGVEPHVITSQVPGVVAPPGARSFRVHRAVEKWNWRSWRPIMHQLGQIRPDILHVQYQAAAYGMHPAINLLPLRARLAFPRCLSTMVTFHDLRVPYLFPKAGPLRWESVLLLARSSDAVIVTNVADEATLERSHVQAERVPIGANIKPRLPSGFDRSAWRSRWQVRSGDALLCHFGFVNRKKGIETLLQALSLLVEAEGLRSAPRLLMIGGKVGSSDPSNVAYLRHVEALVDSMGLADRVFWTGFVAEEEVSAAFAAADCCVLPYSEGVSLQHGTLMAALAHGMPIITTAGTASSALPVPEELIDGDNVLLVPPDNASQLADAILRVLRSPALRRRLGESAKTLSKSFDWEGIAARHLEVYCGLA